MKRAVTFLLLMQVLSLGNAQTSKANPESLVGTWTFLEMRNNKNKKIESYSNGHMIVDATGPTIVFNQDGTFRKIFTPQNEERGYWRYDTTRKLINYDLYIDSTDWVGKDLIKRGEASKYPDGKYYEKIRDIIVRHTATELILNERGSQMVFKRKR